MILKFNIQDKNMCLGVDYRMEYACTKQNAFNLPEIKIKLCFQQDLMHEKRDEFQFPHAGFRVLNINSYMKSIFRPGFRFLNKN